MGVKSVVFFFSEMESAGNVGSGLIGVELNGFPPTSDGRVFRFDGGERADEIADNPLLGVAPPAVPNGINGNICSENRAHVIFQMDKLR